MPGNILSPLHVLAHGTITVTLRNKSDAIIPIWYRVRLSHRKTKCALPPLAQLAGGSPHAQPHTVLPCCLSKDDMSLLQQDTNADGRAFSVSLQWLKVQPWRVSTTSDSALHMGGFYGDVFSFNLCILKNSCHQNLLKNSDLIFHHSFFIFFLCFFHSLPNAFLFPYFFFLEVVKGIL